MKNRAKILISALLAISAAVPVLGGCNIVKQQKETYISENSTASSFSETTSETTIPSVSESIVLKEPDGKTVVDTSYVRLIDGVKPEMMHAGDWIKDGDDKVLMTADERTEFNKNNRGVITAGDKTKFPKLDEFEDTLDGKVLRSFLKDNAKSAPKDPSKYYLNGKPTTEEYWENLKALSNIDGIPEKIDVRFGFTTKRMTIRLFPTEDRVFEKTSDRYYDSMIFSECMPYMPVVVLHESTDGEYLYVVFDSFSAWVRKDAIAICKDRKDWEARQNPSQWLVVTEREIRLGNDPHSPLTTDLILPMGTRMELVPAKSAPKSINQRATYGNYVVKVPTRGSDGYIKDELVLIPVSDDVNAGYLPLTPANIVRQAFKLLGDRYGWGGDLQANDCTGITREIYRCFGILLPRVGQSSSKGVYRVDLSKMKTKQKLEAIEELAPGSLISFPGHMMIYIGTVDGRPYVISAVGTFVAPAPGSSDVLHPRSVVLNSLYVRRRNLTTWLDTATTALTIKKAVAEED
jgi:hypothetical protein